MPCKRGRVLPRNGLHPLVSCAVEKLCRRRQSNREQALRGPLVFRPSHPRGFAWPSTDPHAPRMADITTKRRHRLPALSDAEQYFLLVPGNEHIDGIDSAPCQKVSAAPAAMKTPVRAASFLQKRRLPPGDVPRQSRAETAQRASRHRPQRRWQRQWQLGGA